MSVSVLHHPTTFAPATRLPTPAAARRRLLLLAGCAVSVALAAWLGAPAAHLQDDPELAFLLRGMAAIKALMVLAAVGVLWWRFGHPLPQRIALAYLAGVWLTAAATMLVWKLSVVPLAALIFHAGELMLLLVAWRDGRAASLAAPWRARLPSRAAG